MNIQCTHSQSSPEPNTLPVKVKTNKKHLLRIKYYYKQKITKNLIQKYEIYPQTVLTNHYTHICDVIKQNESELANTDFKI